MDVSRPRALIVDDEPYIRDLLVRLLGREGYDCVTASRAEEGLATIREHQPELMIADINMPGMSGLDLLAEVKREYPDVAVIMVTAVEDRKVAIQALQTGAYAYIIKPFDLNEMVIHVAGAVERRRLTLLSQATQERLEQEVLHRTRELRAREQEIASRLVAAAEFRDTDTGAHVRRIGLYSTVLAQATGWGPQQADDLRVAAMMHDIGKIGVPDGILLKPGPLTSQEFETIKQHTVIGAGILAGTEVPMLEMAREIALRHHERWNGSGYPGGLAGDAIPEPARIVAVVDVYDALVHDRVYRPAMSEDEVLRVMQEGRGEHFDPRIFDLFLRHLSEFRRIRQEVPQSPS